MANAKETLLQLLLANEEVCDGLSCDECTYYGVAHCDKVMAANRLISNGVKIPTQCKNCKWWEQISGKYYRGMVGRCHKFKTTMPMDAYCYYGERRMDR